MKEQGTHHMPPPKVTAYHTVRGDQVGGIGEPRMQLSTGEMQRGQPFVVGMVGIGTVLCGCPGGQTDRGRRRGGEVKGQTKWRSQAITADVSSSVPFNNRYTIVSFPALAANDKGVRPAASSSSTREGSRC